MGLLPGTPTGRWLFTKSGNVDRFGSLLTYEPNSKLAIWYVCRQVSPQTHPPFFWKVMIDVYQFDSA